MSPLLLRDESNRERQTMKLRRSHREAIRRGDHTDGEREPLTRSIINRWSPTRESCGGVIHLRGASREGEKDEAKHSSSNTCPQDPVLLLLN
ncbi:hypothetical protein F2Q69_00062659 [Brassica cretica]|uniref:Uncharacterized protein n=1 Tax=Brassica cretica TaxID=69181 RepID=A0A8S9RBD2_BRACR|nr:hypothetical protein F2Q69_00062659 [Brassica cretica]